MAEWSGYLKRAVATVERRLDEALDMEKPKQEKIVEPEKTEPAGPENEGDAAAEEEDLLTAPPLTFPDLGAAVAAVRQLALDLAQQPNEQLKDAGLDAADAVDAAAANHDAFVADVAQRMTSLHSKIKHLSSINVEKLDKSTAPAAKQEKQIALLLDEGQRLTQQELKLNTLVKKLRRTSVAPPSPSVATSAELDRALADLELARSHAASQQDSFERQLAERHDAETALLSQLAEKNAAIEHYRSLAEASVPNNAEVVDLQRRLDTARVHHTAAADTWNDIETGHLRRIAELEAGVDDERAQRTALLQKLQAAQQSVAEARAAAAERATAADASQEQAQRAAKTAAQLQDRANQLERDLAAARTAAAASEAARQAAQAALAAAQDEWNTREADLVAATTAPRFFESEVSLVSLGPSDAGSPPPSPSRRSSLCSDFDRSGFMSNASSTFRAENSHMLGRLNMTVRRLETELAGTKHALELANADKTSAYNELLAAINAGDEAAKLRAENEAQAAKISTLEASMERLLVKLGEKSERVQELQMDINDLKDAYREQIKTLLK